MSEINWSIKPEDFLREMGWQFKRGSKWLGVRICPFCGGGNSSEKFSLNVHITDGNYFCHRNTCSEKGSFWKLIESQGRNPREYLGERRRQAKK